MLNIVLGNQDKYEHIEDLLTEVKLRTGHYEEHVTQNGKLVYLPKSISFARMDDIEFSKFYNRSIDAVLTHVLDPRWDEHTLNFLVDQVIGFA